jgi:hypothetical protein
MKLTLRIEFSDGTHKDITVSAADMVAFEDKFNVSISKLDDPRIGWLLFLAWHSEKRTKQTEKPYEEWLDLVDSIGETTDPKALASKA